MDSQSEWAENGSELMAHVLGCSSVLNLKPCFSNSTWTSVDGTRLDRCGLESECERFGYGTNLMPRNSKSGRLRREGPSINWMQNPPEDNATKPAYQPLSNQPTPWWSILQIKQKYVGTSREIKYTENHPKRKIIENQVLGWVDGVIAPICIIRWNSFLICGKHLLVFVLATHLYMHQCIPTDKAT